MTKAVRMGDFGRGLGWPALSDNSSDSNSKNNIGCIHFWNSYIWENISFFNITTYNSYQGFLVAQWERIYLSMQETRV